MPDPSGIRKTRTLLPAIYQRAVIDAVVKLDPRLMIRNPVMFVVEAGSILTTLLWFQAIIGNGEAPASFIGAISVWLWFTVLFANFAEALAEGRGKPRPSHCGRCGRIRWQRSCISGTRSGKAGNLTPRIILL